eukprot:Gb_15896 [translate_table: standard]
MIPIKLESSTAIDDWLSVAWIECSLMEGMVVAVVLFTGVTVQADKGRQHLWFLFGQMEMIEHRRCAVNIQLGPHCYQEEAVSDEKSKEDRQTPRLKSVCGSLQGGLE